MEVQDEVCGSGTSRRQHSWRRLAFLPNRSFSTTSIMAAQRLAGRPRPCPEEWPAGAAGRGGGSRRRQQRRRRGGGGSGGTNSWGSAAPPAAATPSQSPGRPCARCGAPAAAAVLCSCLLGAGSRDRRGEETVSRGCAREAARLLPMAMLRSVQNMPGPTCCALLASRTLLLGAMAATRSPSRGSSAQDALNTPEVLRRDASASSQGGRPGESSPSKRSGSSSRCAGAVGARRPRRARRVRQQPPPPTGPLGLALLCNAPV